MAGKRRYNILLADFLLGWPSYPTACPRPRPDMPCAGSGVLKPGGLMLERGLIGFAFPMSSIETTHAYIEIDLQMKRTALQSCESPSLKSPRPLWTDPDLLTWLEAL